MASSGCTETVYQINLPNIGFNSPITLIKVIGDGSCFFHAVLRAFNKEYIQATSTSKRQEIAKKLREGTAIVLEEVDITGRREYDKLGGGSYAEYSKIVSGAINEKTGEVLQNNYSLKGLQEELLSDKPVDHAYIELLSNHLDKDIYLIDYRTKDVYTTGTDLKLLYKNRESIVIIYSPGHYDILGIQKNTSDSGIPGLYEKNAIVFDCLFGSQHPFIQCIRKRLYDIIKE